MVMLVWVRANGECYDVPAGNVGSDEDTSTAGFELAKCPKSRTLAQLPVKRDGGETQGTQHYR